MKEKANISQSNTLDAMAMQDFVPFNISVLGHQIFRYRKKMVSSS